MICFWRYPPSQTTPAVKREYATIGILLLVLIVFGLMLSGCEQPRASSQIPDSNYKVIDTGYWDAEVNVLAEPLWLDNERIIFTSTKDLTPGKRPYRIKVFNIATGKITSTPFYTAFCVRDGVALFQEKDEASGKTTDYRGTLENNHKEPDPSPDMKFDSVYDCDWVPKATYGLGAIITPAKNNLRGDNYLEILERRTRLPEFKKRPQDRQLEKERGTSGTNGKVIYHENQSDPGKAIPFYPPLYSFRYSEYLDAYLVGLDYYAPDEAETRSFWILQRNGDLKEVPYPKTTLVGRNDLFPVKPGYLVHYNGGPLTEEDGTRGLYLIQGEQVQRLIVGEIGTVSISPDGCKVAFGHANSIKENLSIQKPYRTVKYINFCQGGTTS